RENLQPSIVFVFPERADISECRFLHRSIGAGRRAGIAEPNWLAGGGIHRDIPLEIPNTVIAVQHIPRGRLPFNASDSGAGMYERWRAVAPDNYIRTQAKDVTAATVAPERILDDVEVLEHLKIEIHRSTSTRAGRG